MLRDRTILFLSCLLAWLGATGCQTRVSGTGLPTTIPSSMVLSVPRGSLHLTINGLSGRRTQAKFTDIAMLEISLKTPGQVADEVDALTPWNLSSGQATDSFEDLTTGPHSLYVKALDAHDNLIGSASSSVNVLPDVVTSVPLTLQLADTSLLFSRGMVSTLAGGNQAGFEDGVGIAASFNEPESLAFSDQGLLFVADAGNNAIRMVSPDGHVVTFAGNGMAGSSDGLLTSAQFNSPQGLTVDASGTLFVADSGNNLIRQISPTGNVTTLAGNLASGSADGQGAAASFNLPAALAVDANDNLYVADTGNNSIRKIDPHGNVTTLFHSASTDPLQLATPLGIAVSPTGVIYIADTLNNRICKLENGQISVLSSALSYPVQLALDPLGNLYVADFGDSCIYKLTPSGVALPYAGGSSGYLDANGLSAMFDGPWGIALDPAKDTAYVADNLNNRLRIIQ